MNHIKIMSTPVILIYLIHRKYELKKKKRVSYLQLFQAYTATEEMKVNNNNNTLDDQVSLPSSVCDSHTLAERRHHDRKHQKQQALDDGRRSARLQLPRGRVEVIVRVVLAPSLLPGRSRRRRWRRRLWLAFFRRRRRRRRQLAYAIRRRRRRR